MRTIIIIIFTVMSITQGLAQESLLQKSHRISKWQQGERYSFSYEMNLPANPDSVFPLLCPILEYDWLNDWKCTMIYSESGIAEDNCIFYTSSGFPFYKKMTFQVIGYKPNEKIEFLIFVTNVGSVRFSLSLHQSSPGETEMTCNYLLTGHSRFGNKQLKKFRKKEIEKQVKGLELDLAYWLKYKTKRPV